MLNFIFKEHYNFVDHEFDAIFKNLQTLSLKQLFKEIRSSVFGLVGGGGTFWNQNFVKQDKLRLPWN